MKVCEVSGKIFQSGNNVSHAVNKTRRRFEVNLQRKRLFSAVLGFCSLRLSAKGLKIIEAKGGLDAFLSKSKKLFGKGEVLRKRFLVASKNVADMAKNGSVGSKKE